MSPEQMLPGQMLTWLLESVQDVPRNLSLKFHHNQVLRYSWYGQMSRGQKLPGQMLPLQLESVLDVHRNLPLKFHQNRVSNSWDIADIEFLLWGGGVVMLLLLLLLLLLCCCFCWCRFYVPNDLHLKLHPNRVSNNWDIANIEFVWGGGLGRLG